MGELIVNKNLPELIGKGYKTFWDFKGRYSPGGLW